jgi:glutaredoxin-related protein
MPRHVLDESFVHSAIRHQVASWNEPTVSEVQKAVAANDVVVVGMKHNPYPAKACKALETVGQPFVYLEYGNYFSMWKPRTALKMWSGWPTFPMVFVHGVLIGGANDLDRLIASGEFKQMVNR